MKTIKVVQVSKIDECETCGAYESIDTFLYLDEKLLATYEYDNHLGGGYDLGDIEKMQPVFETLGFNFVYERESDD